MNTHVEHGLTFVNEEFAGGAFKSIQWLDIPSLELASFLLFIKSDPDLILSYYVPQIEGVLSQRGELSIVYGSSRACFRLAQRCNIQNQMLYLQPVEKDGHLLHHSKRLSTAMADPPYGTIEFELVETECYHGINSAGNNHTLMSVTDRQKGADENGVVELSKRK